MSGEEQYCIKQCQVRVVRLDLPVRRCLVCYSTNVVNFSATEKWAWQKRQIAESLCQIWSLSKDPYVDKIRRVTYCTKCYENIFNLNTIFRKIRALEAKLSEAQCKIEEELLRSLKIYKTDVNKYNMSLPWDDVRKKIISVLNVAPEIPLEEEDSEDKAFLAWAEGNASNDTKSTKVNSKLTRSPGPARKKIKKQQTVNFSEALTFLHQVPADIAPLPPPVDIAPLPPQADIAPLPPPADLPPSLSPSPSVLSDSDIFNEMIEPTESAEFVEHLESDLVSSQNEDQDQSLVLGNESEEENIYNSGYLPPLVKIEEGVPNLTPFYPCTVSGCRKKFKNSILLVGHTKRVHEGIEKPYMCDICGYAFSIYQDLKNHRVTHFADRPLICEYCGKRFKQWRYLKYHIMVHQGGQTYKCKICDKEFPGPSMLRQHVNTHKSERGYMCEICSAEFRNLRLLRYHQQSKHESRERQIVCEFCPGKTFANPRNLRIHMKRHNDDFDVRCPVCNMGVENETRLKTHMISHSDDLTYFCDICSKGFKHKDSLNLHKKRHVMRANDDRPFQCNICNKRFLAKRYLIRHSVLHNPNGNLYSCEMCEETFPLYHSLTAHVKKCHLSERSSSTVDPQNKNTFKTKNTSFSINTQQKQAKSSNLVPDQYLTTNQHNQQLHLEGMQENVNIEGVTIHVTLAPPQQTQVNLEQQAQVDLESMAQQVNLEQMNQSLNLDAITAQQVNLEPLVQQVTLDSIAQQIHLEPLTQVNLESIGQINLDSMGQISLEPMRQINVEPMTRLSLEPMTQVNLAHMGQISLDSMAQLSRVNVGPMGEVNIEPLTTINIDSLPGISLETLPQMNMESISRINMEPMSAMNLESMAAMNLESMSQANILPPIDQVHLDSIGQQDMDNDDSNYFESVSIDENDSNQMVPQNVSNGPSSCMFEAMDMGAMMEMEASPATTLMETLASYYPDI